MPAAGTREPIVARAWRYLRRAAAVAVIAAIAFLALTPTGCYLSRAGWEEAKILKRRQPIAKLVRDPATDARARAKLQLVLDARRFAADSIGLETKKSFTTFSKLERDTLVLVLSGAYRDRLKAYTWWFPVVGRVPYKGFFDFDAAKRAKTELEKRGFDAYLRPSPAFSTLGWFNDPLLSTSLHGDSMELANTVIHEVTHNTFYAPGQAVFNESFANFVGARGAQWLFRSRGQLAAADSAALQWDDEKRLGRFWTTVYRTLDSAFKAHPDDRAARLAARDTVFAHARAALVHEVAPQLRTVPAWYAQRVRIDNAALMARRIYLPDLDLFDDVYDRQRRDLSRTVKLIITLAKSKPKAPYEALRTWVDSSGVPGWSAADSTR